MALVGRFDACADAQLLTSQEVKQARWAYHQGMSVVAPNIITLCKKNGAKLKEWTPSRPVASISVGPSGGASQVFGIIVGVSTVLFWCFLIARHEADCHDSRSAVAHIAFAVQVAGSERLQEDVLVMSRKTYGTG